MSTRANDRCPRASRVNKNSASPSGRGFSAASATVRVAPRQQGNANENWIGHNVGARRLLVAAPAMAQEMPDIGFKSVGRGRPLAASVQGKPEVGPNWMRQFGQQYDPAHPFPLNGYPNNALPKNYKPLPRDIFTSDDFYKDKELWSDPRYFRCNSPQATEYVRGILQNPPVNSSKNDADAPWGHCEISYPREAIVSPYGFKTAQEHYAALMKETQGPRRPERVHVRKVPGRRVERRLRAPGARRGHPEQLVLGPAYADSDGALGADAGVPAADGAGGLSPDARPRRLALHVLLARRVHAALVPGGRLGTLRNRDARPRTGARRRCAQFHPGRLRRTRLQHGGRSERAECRASALPCRAGTATRSASGTRTC